MSSFSRFQPQLLSVLRIVSALIFFAHGTQKLLGWKREKDDIAWSLRIVAPEA